MACTLRRYYDNIGSYVTMGEGWRRWRWLCAHLPLIYFPHSPASNLPFIYNLLVCNLINNIYPLLFQPIFTFFTAEKKSATMELYSLSHSLSLPVEGQIFLFDFSPKLSDKNWIFHNDLLYVSLPVLEILFTFSVTRKLKKLPAVDI